MNAANHATDDGAIRSLIDQFVEGWNLADGGLCARPFAENADFTAVNGLRARGRDQIGKGHSEILATVFRGTTLSATVNSIDYLRPDVAIVDVTLRLRPGAQTWLPKHTSCGIVATFEKSGWSIAVFRNMVPFERPVGGALDADLLAQSRQVADHSAV
jgi:uncharacterized protein (TIGR02246 family)